MVSTVSGEHCMATFRMGAHKVFACVIRPDRRLRIWILDANNVSEGTARTAVM